MQELSRRSFLVGAGAIAAGGATVGLFGPADYSQLDQDACLQRLYDSLSPRQRPYVCFDAEHRVVFSTRT